MGEASDAPYYEIVAEVADRLNIPVVEVERVMDLYAEVSGRKARERRDAFRASELYHRMQERRSAG